MNLKAIKNAAGLYWTGNGYTFGLRREAERYRDSDEAIQAARRFARGTVTVVDLDDGDRVLADGTRIWHGFEEPTAAELILRWWDDR